MGKNSLSLKKILSLLALVSLLSSNALAEDFLAKLTNNALSDNSQGVKKLTPDEASKVVGGYKVAVRQIAYREMAAIVLPTADEIKVGALCQVGKHTCFVPDSDKVYGKLEAYPTNKQKFKELVSATNNDLNKFVAYSVKKNVKYTKTRPIIYYTSTPVLVGVSNNRLYKIKNISSSSLTREVRWAYEKDLKNSLAFQ